MNKRPLVSMITPGWNGVKFVHRLLDSILAQTYENIEYIYVDDGSSDGTKEVVLSYEEKFRKKGISFKYIYKENGGVSSAINVGLKYVNGEFLCWPEYDDILTPDSVSTKLQYLEEHPDCAVVTSDAWLIYENDINVKRGVLSHNNPNRFDRNHFVQALLSNSIFTAACHMVRMRMFDEVNENREIYSSWIGPNWQMLLPLYYKYNRGFIETPLVYYLIRPNSISHSHNSLQKRVDAIDEYIRILKHTLESIEMSKCDLVLYNKLIDEKYAMDWMNLGIEFGNDKIFFKGFNYFQGKGEVSSAVKIKKIIFNHRFAYKVLKLLKKIVKKIFC